MTVPSPRSNDSAPLKMKVRTRYNVWRVKACVRSHYFDPFKKADYHRNKELRVADAVLKRAVVVRWQDGKGETAALLPLEYIEERLNNRHSSYDPHGQEPSPKPQKAKPLRHW